MGQAGTCCGCVAEKEARDDGAEASDVAAALHLGSSSTSAATPLERTGSGLEVQAQRGCSAIGTRKDHVGPCELELAAAGTGRCTLEHQAFRVDSRHGCGGLVLTHVCTHQLEGKVHGSVDHGGCTGNRQADPRCRMKSRQTVVFWVGGARASCGEVRGLAACSICDDACGVGGAAPLARYWRSEKNAAWMELGEPPCCGGEIWGAAEDAMPTPKDQCRPRRGAATPRS